MNKKILMFAIASIAGLSGCVSIPEPDAIVIGTDYLEDANKRLERDPYDSVTVIMPAGVPFSEGGQNEIVSDYPVTFSAGGKLKIDKVNNTFTFERYMCGTSLFTWDEGSPHYQKDEKGCYYLKADPDTPYLGSRTTSTGNVTHTTKDDVTTWKFEVVSVVKAKYHKVDSFFGEKTYTRGGKATASNNNLTMYTEPNLIKGEFKYPHSLEALNAAFERNFGKPSKSYELDRKGYKFYSNRPRALAFSDYGIDGIHVKTELFADAAKASYVIVAAGYRKRVKGGYSNPNPVFDKNHYYKKTMKGLMAIKSE